MVAAVSETTTRNHTIQHQLLKKDDDDDDVITPKCSVKSKSRYVSSRYLSPSPSNSISVSNSKSLSKRAPSPLISRTPATPVAKRSVSVDRRRPRTDLCLKPNNAGAGDMSAANKLLVTSSRSLSVSFQGEAFSLPISKTRIAPQSPNLIRKNTPERKRIINRKIEGEVGDHVENTKPMDHHRWPGRIRQPNVSVLSKSLSLECEVEENKIRASNLDLGSLGNVGNSVDVLNPSRYNPDGNLVKDSFSDSDTEISSGSGSTSGIQENGSTRLRIRPSGIMVSPKFWQETNSRMRRLQDTSSLLSTSPGPKLNTAQKNFGSKRFSSDNYPLASPKTVASPNRMRPSSPSKNMMTSSLSSPSRGMTSPRRNSVCGISNNISETPSVLSFAVDVRRGKVGENRFFDAHVLRLLYNRQLQWRFVNARSEDTVLKQKHSVEV